MVTTNSPYTRTTWVEDYAWNEIIQEVNVLAENPDEGCNPVGTLEEVEEDYIWNKKDIKKVQDKLIEICPDNEFTELNGLWTSVIIDEIIDAIEIGWCECMEPIEELLGTWIAAKAYGEQESSFGPEYNKCGGRTILGPYWFFTGQDECRYPSPCYDREQYVDSNAATYSIANRAYFMARDNTKEWIDNRREELLEQRKVEEFSAELKAKETQLESLQNQLTACQSSGGDCSSILLQISGIEAEVSELKSKIQEAKDKRDEAKEKAEENLSNADAAAEENWSSLAAMQNWDPTSINIISSLINDIKGKEWGLRSYPYTNYKRSSWSIPSIVTKLISGYPRESIAMSGRFTPSGLPFTSKRPFVWGDEYFYVKECRHQCGFWETTLAECILGEWGDWQEPLEYKSTLNWTQYEGDQLKLYYREIDGTGRVEEYEPNPDQ